MQTLNVVEKQLTDQFGQAVVRTATGPSGLIATGTAGLDIKVSVGDSPLWSRSMKDANDKIRPTQRVRGLEFSADGSLLFVAASDRIQAFDTRTSALAWSYTPPRSFGFLIVSPIALDVNGGSVVAAFDNGTIVVWDQSGNLTNLWHSNDSPRILRMAGPTTMIGTDSFSLSNWSTTGKRASPRRTLPERALGFDAAQNGNVIWRSIHSVVIESAVSDQVLDRFAAPSGLPLVAISADGSRVAVADRHEVLTGVISDRPVSCPMDARVTSLKFCPYRQSFAVGHADGSVSFV